MRTYLAIMTRCIFSSDIFTRPLDERSTSYHDTTGCIQFSHGKWYPAVIEEQLHAVANGCKTGPTMVCGRNSRDRKRGVLALRRRLLPMLPIARCGSGGHIQ
jgi:hypothetical protein